MDRFALRDAVTIVGTDFWGRASRVRLEPVERFGWFWHIDGIDVPIQPSLLASKRNRVTLTCDDHELNVFEHLGALRFSGLDGIRIVTNNTWLPYDGSSQLFWKECVPHMIPAGSLARYTVVEALSFTESTHTSERYISYAPSLSTTSLLNMNSSQVLSVDVLIDYPGLGPYQQSWKFPHPRFGQIARVRTQGWPPSRRMIARLASFIGWPHEASVVWPQEHEPAVVRRLFARHRVLDILGTFSVLCPPGGILVGNIVSRRAGHFHDIALVQKADVRSIENPQLFARTGT